jgi:hypothetical protein
MTKEAHMTNDERNSPERPPGCCIASGIRASDFGILSSLGISSFVIDQPRAGGEVALSN